MAHGVLTPRQRTLVVGDVHGCADELRALVAAAAPDHVVLVGDLYTKGPDPAGVWRQIRDGGWRAVLGNHDQRLLDVIAGERPGDAGGARCVAVLDAADPAWRAHTAALPLFVEAQGWTVVHAGLHPSGELDATTHGMAIAMRRWPQGQADAPPWHEVYTGARRVVFGHDAARGAVWRTRDGEPWIVGLDTGCVYGGALSGLLLETGELLQVPAERVYKPVGVAG